MALKSISKQSKMARIYKNLQKVTETTKIKTFKMPKVGLKRPKMLELTLDNLE